MLNFLYLLIIYPLYQIIEFFYTLCDGIVKNSGLAVIGVSLAVSFLCLPLYVIAEKWQELERQTEKKLKPSVDRIKAVFKGDEQYMILSTYYRQHNYHPAMALRSSLSLLIQIPFFIAAYKFLSQLESLKGYSFLFINDMGSPDSLFKIGNFQVNILPIAMTIINVVAGIIYSKGHPVKEKIQIYIMALFFLVFLYNSPSGLVFYWTMNNVFSLLKNIFYKFKKPLRALYFCLCGGVLFIDIYLIFFHGGFLYRRLTLVGVLCLVPFFPLIIKLINYILNKPLLNFTTNDKERNFVFLSSCLGLSILLGFAIPSFLISSSPMEFCFVDNYNSPFYFVRNTFFQSLGFCLVWPCCIYFLFNKKIKTILAFVFSAMLFCGVINAFIFDGDYGTISTVLTFTNAGSLTPSVQFAIVSLTVVCIFILLIFFLCKINKPKIISSTSIILILSLTAVSIWNSAKISKGYQNAISLNESKNKSATDLTPVFHLSKTEKNVILIMQDRAISGFIPYIFEEKPELYNQYKGFIYYPNTASYGGMTLIGAPAVFGGYEYSPVEINKRKSETLVSKHNEALKMLPRLFDENGYSVTVTDLSWANYSWISDLRIFDDLPSIKQQPVLRYYNDVWQRNHPEVTSITKQSIQLKRNLIWFSFFKIMPPALRETIYDEGHWWTAKTGNEYITDFLNSYSYLYYMNELTDFTSEKPTFTILVNEATHEPVMTGYPNYDLTTKKVGPNLLDDDAHYNCNSSTIYKWGDFFDYLRKENVFDNTRIIIVADHGGSTKLSDIKAEQDNSLKTLPFTIDSFNPLLMVKDFNSNEVFKTDDSFMVNADTPLLLTKGLIQNPKNPYTGKELQKTVSKDKIYIATEGFWSPDGHNKNTFNIKEEDWYSVKDNILSASNFTQEIPND